jgi:hypothetical protein
MNRLSKSSLCLLCCLLLAANACRRAANTNEAGPATTTNAPAGNAPARTTAAGANPRAELTAAVRAQLAAKSYRARMVGTGSNGLNSTTVVEFVAPDRFHMTQDAEQAGRRTRQEIVIVGKDTWMKIGNADWQKFPVDVGQIVTQFRDPKVLDELTRSAEIKYVGPDTLDGAPAEVYEYTLTDVLGKGSRSNAKTWISTTDNLPRKTENDADFNLMGKPVKTQTTVTFSDYNADIKIEPPL